MTRYLYLILGALLTSAVVYAVDPTGFRDINISSSAKIGGTGVASTKAALEISSTTKGLLLPRMTTTQKNAISSPPTGLLVYDTTIASSYIYDGSAWTQAAVPSTVIGDLGKFLQSSGGTSANVWATPGATTGGTGMTSWALGDLLYSSATNTLAKLAGNTTTTNKFLAQVGNGSVSAAPSWAALLAADIPSLAASKITTGQLALAQGGTNADLSATGGTSRVLKQTSTGAAISVAQLACADLSNAVASCSTDTTSATNISSGTLPAGRLPNPSSSTLGGVQSAAAVSHQWINAISTSGVPALSQPACADLSNGAASCSTDTTNATNISSGTLAVGRGGTGQTSYTDGQLLIGNSSGNTLAKGTITAGSGITVTNGGGSVTIAATGGVAAAPTVADKTVTGTQTGWLFTISTSSTLAVGDTYTNNGNTYTVMNSLSAQTGQVLCMDGTGATSGTTLTKGVSASGPSTITFSANAALAKYTPPNTNYLVVGMVGGGGGGGGAANVSANAGGGGGGGAYSTKVVTDQTAATQNYGYIVGAAGTAGGSAGTGGSNGGDSFFCGGGVFIKAPGGTLGGEAGSGTLHQGGAGGVAGTGGDENSPGGAGGAPSMVGGTAAVGGNGGASFYGSGGGGGYNGVMSVGTSAAYGSGGGGGGANSGGQAGGAGVAGKINIRSY